MKMRESLWQLQVPYPNLDLRALRPLTRRDPGPFKLLMGIDEDIFWFGLGTITGHCLFVSYYSRFVRDVLLLDVNVGLTVIT